MRPQSALSLVCCSAVLVCWPWSVGGAQSPIAAQPAILGDVWLEGTVGREPVRAYIADAGWPKSTGLWGAYYFTKNWAGIALDGLWSAPGRIRLNEGDPDTAGAKPRFDLTTSHPSSMEGTWTSADGVQVLPVKLRRMSKPAPFEVAIRRPRQFADPQWPIRLTYPVGWRLDVGATELTLRSPDPRDTMFGNELSCVRGRGVPVPPRRGDPPVNFQWPFFRGETGWLADAGTSGDCTDVDCKPADARSTRAGMFLKASAGYRSHGPWGYMGLANAEFYLVVVEQTWVFCKDRLLDTDTRIGIADQRQR